MAQKPRLKDRTNILRVRSGLIHYSKQTLHREPRVEASRSSPVPAALGTPILGQVLIVTAGCGWIQREGGPIDEIHPGDVIWIPQGEKHWHGASPTTGMTHIAIQEELNGKVGDWMEKVSDEQYRK